LLYARTAQAGNAAIGRRETVPRAEFHCPQIEQVRVQGFGEGLSSIDENDLSI
jgi:hypothetical protein